MIHDKNGTSYVRKIGLCFFSVKSVQGVYKYTIESVVFANRKNHGA